MTTTVVKNGVYFLPHQETRKGIVPIDGTVIVLTNQDLIEKEKQAVITPIRKETDTDLPGIQGFINDPKVELPVPELEDGTIMEGHLVLWPYICTVETEKLEEFKGKISKKCGDEVRKLIRSKMPGGQL